MPLLETDAGCRAAELSSSLVQSTSPCSLLPDSPSSGCLFFGGRCSLGEGRKTCETNPVADQAWVPGVSWICPCASYPVYDKYMSFRYKGYTKKAPSCSRFCSQVNKSCDETGMSLLETDEGCRTALALANQVSVSSTCNILVNSKSSGCILFDGKCNRSLGQFTCETNPIAVWAWIPDLTWICPCY